MCQWYKSRHACTYKLLFNWEEVNNVICGEDNYFRHHLYIVLYFFQIGECVLGLMRITTLGVHMLIFLPLKCLYAGWEFRERASMPSSPIIQISGWPLIGSDWSACPLMDQSLCQGTRIVWLAVLGYKPMSVADSMGPSWHPNWNTCCWGGAYSKYKRELLLLEDGEEEMMLKAGKFRKKVFHYKYY